MSFIPITGLVHVGLPLTLQFASGGVRVLGIDPLITEALNTVGAANRPAESHKA